MFRHQRTSCERTFWHAPCCCFRAYLACADGPDSLNKATPVRAARRTKLCSVPLPRTLPLIVRSARRCARQPEQAGHFADSVRYLSGSSQSVRSMCPSSSDSLSPSPIAPPSTSTGPIDTLTYSNTVHYVCRLVCATSACVLSCVLSARNRFGLVWSLSGLSGPPPTFISPFPNMGRQRLEVPLKDFIAAHTVTGERPIAHIDIEQVFAEVNAALDAGLFETLGTTPGRISLEQEHFVKGGAIEKFVNSVRTVTGTPVLDAFLVLTLPGGEHKPHGDGSRRGQAG